jgi:hypothetical protein
MTMRDSIVALMTDVCTFRDDLKMAEMKIDNMLQELKKMAHTCGLNPKQLMEQAETGEEDDLDEEEVEDEQPEKPKRGKPGKGWIIKDPKPPRTKGTAHYFAANPGDDWDENVIDDWTGDRMKAWVFAKKSEVDRCIRMIINDNHQYWGENSIGVRAVRK